MGLLYEKYYKQTDKELFIKEVIRYSKYLGIPADWLMKVMYVESSLNPKSVNRISNYAGLIQFGDSALSDISRRMGLPKKDYYTKEEIPSISGSVQVELVYYYYYPYKNLIKKDSDLYIATFYPYALNQNDEFILGSEVNTARAKKIARDNPGVFTNKDINVNENPNLISKKSLVAWYDSKSSPSERTKLNKTQEESKTRQQGRKERDGFITYIHVYSNITTLKQLIDYKVWIVPSRLTPPTPTELLNYEDNINSIRKLYSTEEEVPIGQEINNLRVGTKLKIPLSWLEDRFIPFDGNASIVPNDDIETFISEALVKAVTNKQYTFDGIKKIIPKPKVFVYCKSLGILNDESKPRFHSEGMLIDISPYITSINCNTTKVGGNFTISLPPLTCECTPSGWRIKKNTQFEFGENGFYLKEKINSDKRRNLFLFHEIISKNDVVWISLDNKESSNEGFNVDVSKIVDQYWDMIGLVDTNSESISSSNANVSITIGGRDLMKLLIDESSYYLEVSETQEQSAQSEGLIVNDNPESWGRPFRVNNSMQATGQVWSLSIVALRTIGEMFSFIISSLATIEIAPKSLFKGFLEKEERTGEEILSRYTFYDPKDETTNRFIGAGIWSIIKLIIDGEAVNDRSVIDAKLATHTGSLLVAMRTYADDRFVELYGDTYGDQYYYLVRRPPFNKKAVLDYLKKIDRKDITITDDIVLNTDLQYYSGECYSWYRINLPITDSGYRWPATIWPVVFFREYAEIWGNVALDVQSNYIPINKIPLEGEMKSVYETQLFEDMCYLIQSNAYLPFTRQGQIVIKGGKRNIKRGMWISFAPTGEVFYVDGVSHTYSINQQTVERTTILAVSRGMVEYNKSGDYILPYYFKIIDGINNDDKTPSEPKKEESEETRILNVYFDFDKHTLIDKNRKNLNNKDLINDEEKRNELYSISEESLNSLVKDLHDNKFTRVIVYGHTDQNGSDEYNLTLSQKRANIVVEEIIKRWNFSYKEKFDRSKIEGVGKGESKVLQSSDNLEGDEKRKIDALNRRIEVSIIRTESNSNEKSKTESNKQNDFSKLRVNQSVFSFFKTKRQKCEKVEDLESLEFNKNRVVPETIEVEEKTKLRLGEKDITDELISDKQPLLKGILTSNGKIKYTSLGKKIELTFKNISKK